MSAKLFKFIYYCIDTIKTLHNAFFKNRKQYNNLRIFSFVFWFIGLIIDFLYYVLYYYYSLGVEGGLREQALKGLKPAECIEIVEALARERGSILCCIVANLSDLILAMHYIGLPQVIIKSKVSNTMLGICGILAEVSRIRNIFSEFKQKQKQDETSILRNRKTLGMRMNNRQSILDNINTYSSFSKDQLGPYIAGLTKNSGISQDKSDEFKSLDK